MAAVTLSPPVLLLLAVLLLTTVATTQCHGHKRHHHHSSATRPNKTAGAAAANPLVDTVHAICHTTPHPVSCLASAAAPLDAVAGAKVVESSALSVSLLPPNVLSVVLASLRGAVSALSSLSPAFSTTLSAPVTSLRRGAAQDCLELHAATLGSLSRSASLLAAPGGSLPAVRANLAAALTNKATCLDGLAGASGPRMDGLLASLDDAYEHVSNSLALVARSSGGGGGFSAGFAAVMAQIHNRRLLQDDDDDDNSGDGDDDNSGDGDDDNNGDSNDDNGNGDDDSGNADQPAMVVITVAKDGTGNFRTVGEAVAAAPNNSETRTVIHVKAGTYEENVEVPAYKTNIALVGEGRDATVITGSRSAADGWTTFRTATFGVSGEGFLARDITFRNTAGATKGQAVALRVNADLAAVYRCGVDGHQDALYAHSFRQFYRECAVSGTVDVVFGNAAAVLQGCALVAKSPVPGQSNVLTAQGRGDPNEDTGIAVHNCTVAAEAPGLPAGTRTFLGRPWGAYARAVVMDSYLGSLVDPEGWVEWPGAEAGRGDTVYFGEYGNGGPGADTGGRVGWAGVHRMGYDEATQFSVENFIYGDEWLGATSFPYDDDV
ncbi:pectinesterase-like [Phragmites australis]|uniref:pectinesterase-like n=1 Tax=Phragmites australis TaxID=29695 RepID=UPI002D773154|nr:pectinesterase-like [Phragmites australis]